MLIIRQQTVFLNAISSSEFLEVLLISATVGQTLKGHFGISTCLDVTFLPLAEKIKTTKIFLKSDTIYCPRRFLESRPQKYTNIDRNGTIGARYAMLVLLFNAF